MTLRLLASTFLLLVASSHAAVCSPGTYILSPGVCAECPAGTYQPNSDQSGCIPCPAGTVSSSAKSTSCTACEEPAVPNEHRTECICDTGYIFDTYTLQCNACPPGTFYFSYDFGYAYCQPCSPGQYQPHEAQLSCLTCPSGGYSMYGATQCITCPDGQVPTDGVNCGVCAPGSTFQDYSISCEPCYPGTFKSEAGQAPCQRCATDTFAGIGFAECVQCPKGRALMSDGSCDSCDSGEYYDSYSLQCQPCYAGSYSPKKNILSYCLFCGSNEFATSDSKKCKKCNQGKVLLENDKCGFCEPGYFYAGYNFRCEQCGFNTFSYGGSMQYCESCPTGSYALPGSESCTTCPDGLALLADTGECGTCPPGQMYEPYIASCIACYPGTFKATEGIEACESCPTGSVPTDDATACVPSA
eukprot:TRINITY_DN1995_c0_g1_i1.p1 TRINITY_DN1995_c0_g1~~TRINITY_DN1995_c0_g1_i1.p1  ORF type:complete len:441 (+),score=4.87 TRINITY_DN1995_c0_g1_i1:82-1323(+)